MKPRISSSPRTATSESNRPRIWLRRPWPKASPYVASAVRAHRRHELSICKPAKFARVVGLGVLTGFRSRQRLLRSSAGTVYNDAAELLAQLDDALTGRIPSTVRLTYAESPPRLMQRALDEAQRGTADEAPIGCVIANGGSRVIGAAWQPVQPYR